MALTDYDSLGNERRRPLPGREGQGKWDGGKGRARRKARRGDYNYNYKETRHLNASTAPRRTSTAATLFSRERSRRAGRWASMPAHPGSMAPPRAHAARSSLSLTVPTEYWARGGGLARPPPVICEPPCIRDVHHTPTLFLVRLSRAPSFPVTRPSAHPPHLISGPPVRRGAPTCGRARGLLDCSSRSSRTPRFQRRHSSIEP